MGHEKIKVFVYGTLMRGERNAHLMKDAVLLNGNAITSEACFSMIQFPSNSYPGKFSPGATKSGLGKISGEIYEVTVETLNALDELEQNGVHYQRELLEMQDGLFAWLYILRSNDKPSEDQNLILLENKIYSWKRRCE